MPEGTDRTVNHEELLGQLGWVQRLARRLMGDSEAAADVAQDVWLTAQGKELPGGLGLRNWLRSVTKRRVRDSHREDRRRTVREQVAAKSEAQRSTYDVVERNAMQQKVSEAVMDLDEPYRTTILYRYLDGLSAPEIAAKMNTTPEAVRQRLARGRRVLRSRLDREYGGPSGSWAMVLLGASRSTEVAAASSAAVGTGTTGAGTIVAGTGAKAAAAAVVLLGSVAGWRALGDTGGPPARDVHAPATLAATVATSSFELQGDGAGGDWNTGAIDRGDEGDAGAEDDGGFLRVRTRLSPLDRSLESKRPFTMW